MRPPSAVLSRTGWRLGNRRFLGEGPQLRQLGLGPFGALPKKFFLLPLLIGTLLRLVGALLGLVGALSLPFLLQAFLIELLL